MKCTFASRWRVYEALTDLIVVKNFPKWYLIFGNIFNFKVGNMEANFINLNII